MLFPHPLEPATLVRRYKRFLADVVLADGQTITVHCPNSGSMKSCSEPGSPVLLSTSDNPSRRYRHTLEMVGSDGVWVGINTARTNAIVAEALVNGQISELQPFTRLDREVKTALDCRLDLRITNDDRHTYIEVKNCTYVEAGCALFPDAVTARGTKHLNELARLTAAGHHGVIFFLVQRLDADRFAPAAHIDQRYAETLAAVSRMGVQILVYQAAAQPDGISIVGSLPVDHTAPF